MATEDDGLDAYQRAPRRIRLGVGAIILAVMAVLAGTVVMGMMRGDAGEVVVAPHEVATEDIYVHVGGAVREPGLYRLPPDARVVDAVASALGFADDADRDGVNLARVLADGEQLVVPVMGLEGDPAGGGASGVAADGKINLNRATIAELEELPRVGPALAKRIVDWRDENGAFASIDDLLAVSGIGEKMLEAIRPLVSL